MIIKKKGDFEQHPVTPDPIRAVVVDVTKPVMRDTQFGKREKFAIIYETELLNDEGKRWTFWAHGYTPSIAEKSNLGKDLKKILGVTELPDEFDMESIIGKPVRLMVEHRKDGDNIYANLSYLSAHKGENPLTPSGEFVRERDKPEKTGGEYQKVGSAAAPARPSWQDVKVHVGQFAGHAVADLPSIEALDKLLNFWWPSVEAKPSADDKRLIEALRAAKAAMSPAAAPVVETPAF